MVEIILTPGQKEEAVKERVRRAGEKIMKIMEEEHVSFHVSPDITLVPIPDEGKTA